MDQEQINSRKEYVEQVRQSFGEPESGHAGARGYRAYERTEDQTEDNMPGGFWKLRLIFSVLLFLAFVFIWQTDWEWKGISAETIQEKIGTSIELPEGFPELSDVVPISESEM